VTTLLPSPTLIFFSKG